MKKLSKIEAELKKSVALKKQVVVAKFPRLSWVKTETLFS